MLSLEALHRSSKQEIQALNRFIQLQPKFAVTWTVENHPTKYRLADTKDEQPVIPAPAVFASLEEPDKNSESNLPSIGECAVHLELLEAFFHLRSEVINRAELDKVFGVPLEHRVVYRQTYGASQRQPVRLKDPDWTVKKRRKWSYFVTIAVARFEPWAKKMGSILVNTIGDEPLQLPFLPPLGQFLLF